MLAFASSRHRFLLATVVLSACAAAPDASAPVARQTPRVVHRMPTGSTSTASIHTLANAACELSDPAHPGSTLRVFSDDRGVARVQLDHLDTSVRHGELQLDCRDDGGATDSTTLEVVIDDAAAPSPPLPFDRSGLPALSHDRHYPPQPATTAPCFAAWQQLVAADPDVIAPHAIADDVRHSVSSTSNNWSGYVLRSPATAPIYAWIYGEWNVPRVYAESGFYSSDHSSMWVGIDGYGSNDVVQDGTDQDTFTMFWVQTSSYDAWVEWYPLSAQVVSNFPVNPGDRIHSWTWVTDANGNYSAQPTKGWFYMWNQTQNVYVYTSINLPSGVTFNGHSAEWVLERPTVGGTISSLANYSWAQLTNASVYDLWGAQHLYAGDQSDTSLNVTMMNNSTVLSTVAPVSSSTMQFTWHAWQ